MHKEEQILFPFIKQLEASAAGNRQSNGMSVNSPISVMEAEHEAVGQYLAEIRSLTHDFTPPGDSCTTYKLLYNLLADFEDDLHLHIHLENNILFPKALELEKMPG